MTHKTRSKPEHGQQSVTAIEQCYTVAEIGKMWKMGTRATTELFRKEPGVLGLTGPNRKRTRLRIPRSVLERVSKRLTRELVANSVVAIPPTGRGVKITEELMQQVLSICYEKMVEAMHAPPDLAHGDDIVTQQKDLFQALTNCYDKFPKSRKLTYGERLRRLCGVSMGRISFDGNIDLSEDLEILDALKDIARNDPNTNRRFDWKINAAEEIKFE